MIDTIEKLSESFWDMGSESAVNDGAAYLTEADIVAEYRDVIDAECRECRIPVDLRDRMAAAFVAGYISTTTEGAGR